MNRNLAATTSALFLSIFATACGGGGGGGEASTEPTALDAVPAMVNSSVTPENGENLAAQSYNSTTSLNGQANQTNQIAFGVALNAQNAGLLDASLALLSAMPATSANLAVGATVTENCSNGGSITVSESATTLSITAYNCGEGSLVMNGGASFVFSNITGTLGSSGAWSATMALTYQNFSIQSGTETTRATGDMTVNYSQTSSSVATATGSGQSLHMRYLENGTIVLNTLLQPFSFTASQNNSNYTSSVNFTYAGSGTKISPTSYTVVTTSPFLSTGTAFPHAGALTLTATDNSTATLTALDNTNVRIDLDTNGDGTTDETTNTTWIALSNQL